jgi:hypothetical protein
MLRALVVVLLLANAGFWAWRQGWLEPLHGVIGARPEGEREPERLARQVNPQAVRLIPGEAASAPARPAPAASAASAAGSAASDPAPTAAATASAAAPTLCLEAGPFAAPEVRGAEAALGATLPAGSWTQRALSASWWVAMGPFSEVELLQKKRAELRRRGITPDTTPAAPGTAPVLVISRHESRAAAESALAAWSERGVRSARVVNATVPQIALRVAQADAATQGLLTALPPERLRGRSFAACPDGSL